MNSNLLKICLASLLALSFTACGDDDNGDNNGGNTISCTASEKKCNPGNTGLLVCNAAGNAWDKGDDCAFGCENNACKPDPNGGGGQTICTPNSIECNNNKLLKCNADGSKIDEEPCTYGCEKGETTCNVEKCTTGTLKCNDDQTAALTCNANGTWDEEPCTDGCNSGACVKCEVGATKCGTDHKSVLTCQENGSWTPEACKTNEACTSDTKGCDEIPSYEACSAEDLEKCLNDLASEGYDRDSGVCLMANGKVECNTGKCTELNTVREWCSAYYSAMLTQICSPVGDDGTGVWTSVAKLEDCFSCNDDLTACGGKLVSDQGEECDKTRADRCDGNILSYCAEGTVKASKCSSGRACVELDNKGSVWANCYDPEDTCQAEDESQSCEENWLYGAISEQYVCLSSKADPEKKYLVHQTIGCQSGECTEDGAACAEPLVEDLFEDCTAESRPDRCDGTVYSTCYYDEDLDEEYVAAADCAENDNVCATLSGKTSCYNTCEEVSETPTPFCYYSDAYKGFVVGTSVCVEDDSKENRIQKQQLTKLCASGCNETNDGCAYADEGEKCPEGMTESCVDNAAVYCYVGNIAAESCPGLYGENQICYINEDDESWCAEKCDTLDGVATECITEEFLGFEYAYQVSKTCTKTKDDKLVYNYIMDEEDPDYPKIDHYCDDQGCNKDNTACIAIDEEDEG